MKVLSVGGTRPNFLKLAPLAKELARRPEVEHVVVETGQRYDAAMSEAFFRDIDIAPPRHSLGVGCDSPAGQTAAVLSRLEPVLLSERPDVVVVYGDVNSTFAAALAAAKLNIRVAHVEAGLRSRDRTMPEEINRLLTDQIADLLFAPSADAVENLHSENIPDERIHFVGNIMIDLLKQELPRVRRLDAAARHGVKGMRYVVATLHSPSNVDDPARLRELVGTLEELSRHAPVLFPVHPHTRRRLTELGIRAGGASLRLLNPLNYTEMLGLVASAGLVITDSGALQEETTYLGIACLTVRPNTARPITCTQGTNRLVAAVRGAILGAAREALLSGVPSRPIIDRWDGRTGERIASVLCDGAMFRDRKTQLRELLNV